MIFIGGQGDPGPVPHPDKNDLSDPMAIHIHVSPKLKHENFLAACQKDQFRRVFAFRYEISGRRTSCRRSPLLRFCQGERLIFT